MKAKIIHVRSGGTGGLYWRKTGLFSGIRGLMAIFLMPALLSANQAPTAASNSDAMQNSQTENQPALSTDAATDVGQDWKFVLLASSWLTYDDNIFIQPSDKKEDIYLHIAPTFAAGLGNFRSALASFAPIPHFLVRTDEEELPWKNFAYASYTPDGVLFSKYHGEDVVNNDVKLAAQQERDRWNLNGSLHFQTESDPVIDVGRRIKQTYYTANADAAYMISGKLTGGVRLYGNQSDYSGGFASTDGRTGGYLDYQIAPKTAVGVGLTGGHLDPAHGADQTYEQPLLDIKYQPTAKLSFAGQTGAEFRQFDSNVSNRSHFIFDLIGNFDPTDSTEMIFTTKRDTVASAEYAGENVVGSVYQGSVRQRFLQRLYLSLAGGLVHNNYENNEPNSAIARRDDYYFYQVSSSADLTRRGTIELSYEHRDNDSSFAAFKFTEDLVSFAVSYLF
jgi:hypothetical protein